MSRVLIGIGVVSNTKELEQMNSWCLKAFEQAEIELHIGFPFELSELMGSFEFEKVSFHQLIDFAEICEINRHRIFTMAPRSDYVLLVDPDEEWTAEAVKAAHDFASKSAGSGLNETGAIPFVYKFGQVVLKGTPWGGVKLIPRVVQSKLYSETPEHVHQRPSSANLQALPISPILHNWVDTWAELRAKHDRYLRFEGQSRLSNRGPFSYHQIFWNLLKSSASVVKKFKFADGLVGVGLSFEFLRYQLLAELMWIQESKREIRANRR